MDDAGRIILEIIAAFSVLACIAYLILRAKKHTEDKVQRFDDEAFGSRSVTVSYEQNNIDMKLYFYKNGLLLERSSGETLCIPVESIVSVSKQATGDSFTYNIEFEPGIASRDNIGVICTENITDMLLKVITADKFVDINANNAE